MFVTGSSALMVLHICFITDGSAQLGMLWVVFFCTDGSARGTGQSRHEAGKPSRVFSVSYACQFGSARRGLGEPIWGQMQPRRGTRMTSVGCKVVPGP